VTQFHRKTFSVPGDMDGAEHRRIFGVPKPATAAARLEGCTCPSAVEITLGCPLHPLDYLPQDQEGT
jgi:hypothetical protein